MKEIVSYLTQLDFTKIEIKLYLTLLKNGSMTVAQLAEKANVNRTAAYTHIDSLFKKGILIKMKGQKNEISATLPDNLKYLVETKISTTKKLEIELPSIVRSLNTSFMSSNVHSQSETTYYKGVNGIKAIHTDAFSSSEVRIYANLQESEKILLPDNLDIFDKFLAKNKKLKIYEIVMDPPESVAKYNLEATAKSGRYFYKFMPTLVDFTAACVFIYDDKVAIINLKDKVDCIVLNNPDYFIFSKKIFDFNWQILPNSNINI